VCVSRAASQACPPGSLPRDPNCTSWRVLRACALGRPARRQPGPTGPPPPCGGTGCDGLSWALVFRALPGASGGGSGTPTTQWGGGNRQALPGKPSRHRTDSPSHQHLFWVETSCRSGSQKAINMFLLDGGKNSTVKDFDFARTSSGSVAISGSVTSKQWERCR
jgi:hypothetical protein